jgi:hypothetical protein
MLLATSVTLKFGGPEGLKHQLALKVVITSS